MLKPFWKLTNILLSLAGFFTVGIMALNAEEELVWVVCKAVAAFVVCWIAFNYMGAMLFAIVDSQKLEEELDLPDTDSSGTKRG